MSYDLNFPALDLQVKQKAADIKLLITDIDGVWTDGAVTIGPDGEAFKSFNILDGLGAKLLQRNGIDIAVITGRNSSFVEQRATALGIKYIYQGCEDKHTALADIQNKSGLTGNAIAHIGDDLPDLFVMTRVGLGIAVKNAHPFVAENASWQTSLAGGSGAFREAADMLLFSQGKLTDTLHHYTK